MSTPNTPEPMPNKVEGPAVWDLVKADIDARDTIGAAKYGQRLTAGDGRRSLVDAYQESLDLVVYLRKQIEEEAALRTQLQSAQEEVERQRNAADEAASLLASATDFANSWARESYVQEARTETDLKRVISDLWTAFATLRKERDAALEALKIAYSALEVLEDGACGCKYGPGCDMECKTVAHAALAAIDAARGGKA